MCGLVATRTWDVSFGAAPQIFRNLNVTNRPTHHSTIYINTSILRVTFYSETSVHGTAQFVLNFRSMDRDTLICRGLALSNSWHHVAAVIERIGSTLRTAIYVNGSLESEAVEIDKFQRRHLQNEKIKFAGYTGVAIGRADISKASPLLGGAFAPDAVLEDRQGADSYWASELDEIRVWNSSRFVASSFPTNYYLPS